MLTLSYFLSPCVHDIYVHCVLQAGGSRLMFNLIFLQSLTKAMWLAALHILERSLWHPDKAFLHLPATNMASLTTSLSSPNHTKMPGTLYLLWVGSRYILLLKMSHSFRLQVICLLCMVNISWRLKIQKVNSLLEKRTIV